MPPAIPICRIALKTTSPGSELSPKLRSWTISAILLAAGVLVATGCGEGSGDGGPESGLTLDQVRVPLPAGSPGELVAIRSQANELLEEDLGNFEARLEELRGIPVVINKWASWCGPCIFEFPHFQQAAIARGDEVAFIGLDSNDVPAAALTFLRDLPVPYPSYSDPDEELARAVGADQLPTTIFINADGETVETKFGPYESTADLVADIDRLFGSTTN